jgi:hypothetical protein
LVPDLPGTLGKGPAHYLQLQTIRN